MQQTKVTSSAARDDLRVYREEMSKLSTSGVSRAMQMVSRELSADMRERRNIDARILRRKKRLRILSKIIDVKQGRLPVREHVSGGFVRYNFQSLIYSRTVLPVEYEWFMLSRRLNISRGTEVLLQWPDSSATLCARFPDKLRTTRGKQRLACTDIPLALSLLSHGGRFICAKNIFPHKGGSIRCVSSTPIKLWVGRIDSRRQ